MRFLKPSLLLTWALLAPPALLGAALPVDGGEPGKAYRACLEAIAKQDKAGIIALCFSQGDPWLEKTNLDHFTPETFAFEVRQLRPEFRLAEVVISGGQVHGDKAELQVTGQMTGSHVSSPRARSSRPPAPVKGTVFLVRSSSGWRPSDSTLDRPLD